MYDSEVATVLQSVGAVHLHLGRGKKALEYSGEDFLLWVRQAYGWSGSDPSASAEVPVETGGASSPRATS